MRENAMNCRQAADPRAAGGQWQAGRSEAEEGGAAFEREAKGEAVSCRGRG